MKSYYQNLLSTKITNKDDNYEDIFFENKDIPKLNEEEKKICEGLITFHECELVVKEFKCNKSPGNDGLSIEFYKQFWNEIKHELIDCYNYSLEIGELSNSQKQAIISLLDKGKDRLYIKNWRPISLLNVDYKIMTKSLANRVKKILPKLIHYNQCGFVEKRYMGDAVRTLLDIIELCKKKDKMSLLLMLDFEKAYDSIERDFLSKTLKKI